MLTQSESAWACSAQITTRVGQFRFNVAITARQDTGCLAAVQSDVDLPPIRYLFCRAVICKCEPCYSVSSHFSLWRRPFAQLPPLPPTLPLTPSTHWHRHPVPCFPSISTGKSLSRTEMNQLAAPSCLYSCMHADRGFHISAHLSSGSVFAPFM